MIMVTHPQTNLGKRSLTLKTCAAVGDKWEQTLPYYLATNRHYYLALIHPIYVHQPINSNRQVSTQTLRNIPHFLQQSVDIPTLHLTRIPANCIISPLMRRAGLRLISAAQSVRRPLNRSQSRETNCRRFFCGQFPVLWNALGLREASRV